MSPYLLILNDVSTLCSEVAGFEGSTSRVVRKRIIKNEDDPLPLLIIAPDHQAKVREGFEGAITIERRVGVAIVYQGNQTLETGLANIIEAVDATRKKLHVTSLPTATSVRDSTIDMDPVFDVSALDKNLDYSVMEVTYFSEEDRN
jgi:hypothetical protein